MQNRNYSRYRVFHLKVNEIKPIFGYVLMNFEIPGINNALVGDGYCQDLTNTAECNFDGGDCCGSCKITTIYPAVYLLGL